ncbi:PI-PLC domain-containing protein [Streptomyces varsoviensis]|uniref:phospholipase n=1 Tax=Streptomyces varsoviensis TaxID=67373 RepID=UPI0012FE91A9|nr:phospholipase [Streptomyces varsoviensis]
MATAMTRRMKSTAVALTLLAAAMGAGAAQQAGAAPRGADSRSSGPQDAWSRNVDARSAESQGDGARSASAPDVSQRQQPTWAIAHRVLTVGGVTKALEHGANAVEIDATAWKQGWWADHDGTLTSYGDTMADMFDRLAKERDAGKNIGFVWLDLKNPDYCKSGDAKWRHCSLAALRDLARDKLESHGIRVLYGFYNEGDVGGSGWNDVSSGLTAKEAVSYSGDYSVVAKVFERHGGGIPARQRVMDKGTFMLGRKFPTAPFPGIQQQVRLGSQARDRGEFARTFSWTVRSGDGEYAKGLLDRSAPGSGADGLIYGFMNSCYPDGVGGPSGCGSDYDDVKRSLSHITDYVAKHPDTRRMATTKDVAFGS